MKKGKVEIAWMYIQVGEPPGGPPTSMEEQSSRAQFDRAVLFAKQSEKMRSADGRIALLAAAVTFAHASLEHLEYYVSKGWLKEECAEHYKRISYKFLISVIRNHEMHGFALPAIDGDYWLGPTHLEGPASIQLVDAIPKRRLRKDGRILHDKPLLLCVRQGRVFALDESKSKSVEVAFALSKFLQDLGGALDHIFAKASA